MKKLLLFLAIGTILGGLLAGLTLLPGIKPGQDPQAGVPVEDFSLPDLQETPLRLSQYRGKTVVLNFWATWCPPCQDEMALLQKYASAMPDQVVVVGVNSQEPLERVRAFAGSYGLSFPIVSDGSGEILRRFRVQNYPTTFFIDPKGILRAQHVGALNDELMQAYLRNAGVTP